MTGSPNIEFPTLSFGLGRRLMVLLTSRQKLPPPLGLPSSSATVVILHPFLVFFLGCLEVGWSSCLVFLKVPFTKIKELIY